MKQNGAKKTNLNNSFVLPEQSFVGLSAMSTLNPTDIRSSSRLSGSPNKNLDATINKGAGIKGVGINPIQQ
jgi:hypothetical protein